MSPKLLPDSAYIQGMFDHLAPRYDLFNELTSFGRARYWRREALKPLLPGMRVLDLGCGTGDLALEAIQKIGSSGEVVGLDFSKEMLSLANKRYEKLKLNHNCKFRLVNKKAEELPIDGELYDLIVSGFVLRNLYENIDTILKGVYSSLKQGGQISFLDITEPGNAVIRFLWRAYMMTVVALYGKILFGKKYPIAYLPESANRFMRSNDFLKKLGSVGFKQVRARSFMFGVITLYQAVK